MTKKTEKIEYKCRKASTVAALNTVIGGHPDKTVAALENSINHTLREAIRRGEQQALRYRLRVQHHCIPS